MTTPERVRPEIRTPLARLSLAVEDVAIMPAGRRRVVRVLVERDLSGVDPADTTSRVPPLSLDEVAEATRAVSDALDASDVMGQQPYVLEVSSLGVERPLRGRAQFRRNVGRLVEVVTESGERVVGRITSVTAEAVELDVPGRRPGAPGPRTLELGQVASAVVQVEFERPDDPSEDEAKESADGH